MCGIVGVLHRDQGLPVAGETIRRMCDAIRHRGPDDDGAYLAGPVGLGMRRLAIIDPARGRQPISTDAGEATIVFNGEIYNYRELRSALVARGHRFHSDGDTETVLHEYVARGPAVVDRLRGMFAFAIWDRRQRQLFLARDRYGIKPLYYVDAPWGIAFASELKALVAIGATERALDWAGIDAYFELGYFPAPTTPFTDVRKLPPGHTLTWSARDGAVLTRYWDPSFPPAPPPPDAELQVRELLDDSVTAHLVSDVPVAAFLSGGLDSSAVASSMALLGHAPHAFTARYQGSGASAVDETGLARLLAERYGMRLTVIDIAPKVDEVLEPIAWALDEPLADDSAIPSWELARAVGGTYKVALTGIGGDELFAGYRRHIGLLWSERYARLPSLFRRGIGLLADGTPLGGTASGDRLRRFVHAGGGDAASRFLRMVALLPPAERRSIYRRDVTPGVALDGAAAVFAGHLDGAGHPAGLSAGLQLDTRTFLPDDVLALADRLSMAHGLELRVPFVDHRFAAGIVPLSDRTKIGWGRPKALLRRALAGRLPAAHFQAPKRGFVGPTSSWLRRELRPLLLDELSPSRISRLGYFEPKIIEGFITDQLEGRRDRGRILWALLAFSLWHRLYVEPASVVGPTSLTGGSRTVAGSPG
jgi:asparagine synthase (glutamine-hydrolysing)